MHKGLKKLYEEWIMKEYVSEKVRKLIGKINNGFEYWFTLSFTLV